MQHTMTASSLGAAIVGCPSASQLLPGSWRTALLHNCLDDKSRLAVFRTCRSGRDWVWQGSESATLTCDLDGEPQAVVHRMCAARQWLGSRTAPNSTRLSLTQTTANQSNVLLALATLHQATHLSFDCLHLYSQQQSSALLSAASSCCPHLTSLHLGRLHAVLPHPAQLPHLTDLTVHASFPPKPLPDMDSSILRLVPQLTSLKLDLHAPPRYHLVLANPAPHLRTLKLEEPLTDPILSLLLQHAPQLEDLTAEELDLRSDQHAAATWRVRRLELLWVECGLHWLPESQHPDFTLVCVDEDGGWVSLTATATGLPPRLLSQLGTWRFVGFRRLDIALGRAAEQHSTALGVVLQQLALVAHNLPPWSVHLCTQWAWDAQLLQQVSTHTAATLLPHLHVDINELTDTSLDLLLQHGRGIPQLSAWRVSLATDHSRRTLPWSSITIRIPLSALALLHLPLGPEGRLTVHLPTTDAGIGLDITEQQVSEGCAETLVVRLQHFQFTAPSHLDGCRVGLVCPAGLPAERQPAVLRAHLQVLCAVKAHPSLLVLNLRDWTYTREVVTELSGLPEGAADLSLSGTWPEGRGECCQLGRVLPASCKILHLYGPCQSKVVDVLVGLSQRQAFCEGLDIRGLKADVIQQVTPYLEHLGLADRVSFEACCW